MTEEERKHYNKKLMKETFADEVKKPRFSWRELLINTIGCALGLILCQAVGISERFGGAAGVALSVLVIAACLALTELAAAGIAGLSGKNRNN